MAEPGPQPIGTGGQGDGFIARLDDPRHLRRTIRTLRRAIKERWEMPAEACRVVPREMLRLVEHAEEERVRVSAATALTMMGAQNQKDEHAVFDRIAPKPQSTPAVTVNVQQGIAIKLEE